MSEGKKDCKPENYTGMTCEETYNNYEEHRWRFEWIATNMMFDMKRNPSGSYRAPLTEQLWGGWCLAIKYAEPTNKNKR